MELERIVLIRRHRAGGLIFMVSHGIRAFPSCDHGTSIGNVKLELQVTSQEAEVGCWGMREGIQNL